MGNDVYEMIFEVPAMLFYHHEPGCSCGLVLPRLITVKRRSGYVRRRHW